MPCSDGAPAEWVTAREASDREAAEILCAMVSGASADYTQVPLPLLTWYYRHREIDLVKNADARDGGTTKEKNVIYADLLLIKAALANHPEAS